jgi:hypothetical protein
MPPAETLLIALPTDGSDPLRLLRVSEGGGRVPTRFRHRWTSEKPPRGLVRRWMEPPYGEWGRWVHYVVSPENTETERALLLILAGRPDDLGMGRAVLRANEARAAGGKALKWKPYDGGEWDVALLRDLVNDLGPTYRLVRVGEDGREVGGA